MLSVYIRVVVCFVTVGAVSLGMRRVAGSRNVGRDVGRDVGRNVGRYVGRNVGCRVFSRQVVVLCSGTGSFHPCYCCI